MDNAAGSASQQLLTTSPEVQQGGQPMLRVVSNPVREAIMACRQITVANRKQRRQDAAKEAHTISPQLYDTQRLLVDVAGSKGVSSWLTVQPLHETATILNKQDFRDALAIRYGWSLAGLATSCVCGSPMTTDHAFVCPCGGYPSARHNDVRDLIADVLKEVSTDVETEPTLLPFDGENLPGRSSNRSNEARLDIRARGFWTRQQDAFFDIRVTHPKASLLSCSEVKKQLARNEREKKRQYANRVACIDHGAFTPLVFATNGQCASESAIFLKELVSQLVTKNQDLCPAKVMQLVRSRISFCLLRWAITSLRGSRSSYQHRRGFGGFANQCRQHGLTT